MDVDEYLYNLLRDEVDKLDKLLQCQHAVNPELKNHRQNLMMLATSLVDASGRELKRGECQPTMVKRGLKSESHKWYRWLKEHVNDEDLYGTHLYQVANKFAKQFPGLRAHDLKAELDRMDGLGVFHQRRAVNHHGQSNKISETAEVADCSLNFATTTSKHN